MTHCLPQRDTRLECTQTYTHGANNQTLTLENIHTSFKRHKHLMHFDTTLGGQKLVVRLLHVPLLTAQVLTKPRHEH